MILLKRNHFCIVFYKGKNVFSTFVFRNSCEQKASPISSTKKSRGGLKNLALPPVLFWYSLPFFKI
ncbi:hypothetical protein [Enterococcus phage vB_Efs22_KEN09]